MDRFTIVFVLLSVYVQQNYGGECPSNPTTAIQKCSSKIDLDLHSAGGHKFITDPAYTELMCKNNKVSQAIDCMEKVYGDCMKSGSADMDLMMNPAAWRSAFKEVCDNKKFLADNSACLTQDSTKFENCVKEHSAKASADTQLKMIHVGAGGKDAQADIFKIVCNLSKQIMICFDDTITKHCPKKVKSLVHDVIYKFLPPICHPADGKKGSYATVNDGGKNVGSNGIATNLVILVGLLVYLF